MSIKYAPINSYYQQTERNSPHVLKLSHDQSKLEFINNKSRLIATGGSKSEEFSVQKNHFDGEISVFPENSGKFLFDQAQKNEVKCIGTWSLKSKNIFLNN